MGAGRARPGWAGQGWVEQGRAGQGSPRLPPLFSRRSPAVNGRPAAAALPGAPGRWLRERRCGEGGSSSRGCARNQGAARRAHTRTRTHSHPSHAHTRTAHTARGPPLQLVPSLHHAPLQAAPARGSLRGLSPPPPPPARRSGRLAPGCPPPCCRVAELAPAPGLRAALGRRGERAGSSRRDRSRRRRRRGRGAPAPASGALDGVSPADQDPSLPGEEQDWAPLRGEAGSPWPPALPCPALLRAVPPRPSAAPRSPAPPVPCGGGAGGAGAAPSPVRRRGREGESRRAAAGRGARPRDSAVLQKTLWPAALREVLSAGVRLGTFLLLQVLLGVTERRPLGSGDAQMCIFYYFCA